MNAAVKLDDIYLKIGAYLKEITGYDDKNIRRAYQDNIGVPSDCPFVYISIAKAVRNASNQHIYDAQAQSVEIAESMILDIQLDFYGQDSWDQTQQVKMLFRDEFSTDYFKNNYEALTPLYADDIVQTSDEDENSNWKVRNTMTLHFNLQIALTIAQQFFDEISLISSSLSVKKNDADLNI
ncbi:MAG: hypothetical protein LBV16_06320 [Elusimicrobiota bacterium]|jgi:hypothetical protein|nr:hypothetical protein [Elusimicrobiota bacterium]